MTRAASKKVCWENTFNAWHVFGKDHGHEINVTFDWVKKNTDYPYVAWNGWVYDVKRNLNTGVKTEDLR